MPTTSPSRERLRPSELSSVSTPASQASLRMAPSSSSATLGQVYSVVSLDAALAAHVDAPSPTSAALEQILSERNILSSQNSQLWKLIEKQRSGYNKVLKELERVRYERDAYKSRLNALGESTELLARRDKDKDRSLKSSASISGLDTIQRGKLQGNGNTPDHKLFRNHSDDIVPGVNEHHNLSSSNSREPMRMGYRQNSQDEVSLPSPTLSESIEASLQQPPRITIPSGPSGSAPSSSISPRSDLPYTALSDPALRQPSNGELSSFNTSSIRPLQIPPRKASTSTMNYSTTTPQSSQYHHSNSVDAETSTSSLSLHDALSASRPEPTLNSIMKSMPPDQPGGATLMPLQPWALSRESRISLPDEAKRYIANMSESPAPSPRLDVFGTQRTRSESPAQMRHESTSSRGNPSPLAPVVESEPPTSKDVGETTDGEFLDLGDESSVSDLDRVSADDDARIVRHVRNGSQASQSTTPHAPVTPKVRPAVPAVEDFPLPPSRPMNGDGQSQSRAQTSINSDAHSSNSALSQNDISSLQPPSSSGPTFRALPLLPTDLPNTRAFVSNSSIKPNDRGKEVLSFTISVEPGSGKEGWKVEKLFSDVLVLDQRVRASVGKSVIKKIASLPDGKLWRDRAPIKSDQRKAALENYIQSLIKLPVKNKDELIAFLTSDILRETKKPISQAGYKEGYLTKRGKNFGGWKLRYFVLQGPVLEYYESRGGAHLGSITITGAQIGRQQQKTGVNADADDENEYRHAFLVIEGKKAVGSSTRHVLCAESDEERDNWVDVLVRYVMGAYNDEPGVAMSSGPMSVDTQMQNGGVAPPRTSISSSNAPSDQGFSPVQKRARGMSKDDIAKGPAVPIAQLAPDVGNAKLFQGVPHVDVLTPSPSKSNDASFAGDVPLSNSLPVLSPSALDSVSETLVDQRANSEMGHYPDLQDHRVAHTRSESTVPEHRPRDRHMVERPASPEVNAATQMTPKPDANGRIKISGPLNGAPIPSGFKFGAKDAPDTTPSASERREKAKSRTFWGFGRGGEKAATAAPSVPRVVFGVAIEEALDVAEIANLPAIAFRCIQYLEAKKADQEEGIYRLSGSSAEIKGLKDRFNAEGDVDLLGSGEYWDPHAIAGLFKTYLRELPTSILTRDLHLKFLAVMDFVDPNERISELSQLIATLPLANYSLLRALTAHLILIVQNAGVNKMTMRNVGIVFSPTLAIPAGVFSLMLGEFNRVFNVNADQSDTPPPEEESGVHPTQPGSPLNRRNSRQYADAAADQLLGFSGRKLNPTDEGNSDEGEDISVHDESGTETTENDTVESFSSSYAPQHVEMTHEQASSDSTVKSTAGRARGLAATRGLNVYTGDKTRRQSRMLGLPRSPRPPPSPHTPGSSVSPLHTPK